MASGFQSKYNDSGYTLTLTGTWYDSNNNVITQPISGSDIYNTTQQCGVYMINGVRTSSSGSTIYPIISSMKDLRNASIPIDVDDAWLIYPGYGFIIYDAINYTGGSSNVYTNTSNIPQLYYIANKGWDRGFANSNDYSLYEQYGTVITSIGKSQEWKTSGYTNYRYVSTTASASVQIYFRGVKISIPELEERKPD